MITQNGRATAVLQDVRSFKEQRQALFLLKFLAQGTQELTKDKGIDHALAKRHFEKKLKVLGND